MLKINPAKIQRALHIANLKFYHKRSNGEIRHRRRMEMTHCGVAIFSDLPENLVPRFGPEVVGFGVGFHNNPFDHQTFEGYHRFEDSP